MASSLDKLVENTPDLEITRAIFGNTPLEKELFKIGKFTSENERDITLREMIDKPKLKHIISNPEKFELGSRYIKGLDLYINNREKQYMKLTKKSRDDSKKDLFAIINGREIYMNLQKKQKAQNGSKYNIKGSATNLLMCRLENQALIAAFDYLNGIGVEVSALVFDVKEMDLGYNIQVQTSKNNQDIKLLRKGVYPYDYVDGLKKLAETQLPTKTEFYSKLSDLVAVHMKKTKIRFDKPVYLGMCSLDLSKTLMYEFHYYYIKPNYILDAYGTSGAKLLFTDTDSLAYEIKTEDFYADINENVEQMFDTSNFPADHPSGIKSGVNKKVVGMFKDECGGKIMHEFVGLRAKLYS
ncbi:hypothetical protein MAR_006016 [Mya arenaria]|uniref:Uncharacterized protein n=1 Tax=Mya arenaria TaxID=6604 RepID=A0ABY7DET7_MYAAR|nr:hypothetical protein MAR_006016 [Mya arenaria]